MTNYRKVVFTILIFLLSGHCYAEFQECTSDGDIQKYGSFSITKENNCVILKCNISGTKNIESALAVCHQVEKDFKLCGWERKKPIKDAVIRVQESGKFNVSIKRCEI